ncbi:MAG: HpaII family restriction endonuclease [Methanomicrobium sp.]|nr:HpaII family restriction endonuclease [Methanomicrobium sp.]
MKANKGEWSELYVLLRLLADGKLYSAGPKLEKFENVFSPILRIIRQETDKLNYEYISKSDRKVELYINDNRIVSLDRPVLGKYAESIFNGIITGQGKGAFEIHDSSEILDTLKTQKIKAPSTDKTDIRMEIYDRHTGIQTVVGYSIKSDLGMPPTLMNPSKSTNFKYEICGNLSDADIKHINSINTDTKIRDRITAILEKATFKFSKIENSVFSGNIMLIDSRMDVILGDMLCRYYTSDHKPCAEIVTLLEESDPLNFKRPGIYRYKFKKFLCSIALGMLPAKEWNGMDDANGGYIIVKTNGDVVAYHLYNRDAFEAYLLNNTIFDTPSTTRYDYAKLYREEDGKVYMDLNMQIRFRNNG